MFLVRGARNHEAVAVGQPDIVMRVFHVLMLRTEITIEDDRRHMLPPVEC